MLDFGNEPTVDQATLMCSITRGTCTQRCGCDCNLGEWEKPQKPCTAWSIFVCLFNGYFKWVNYTIRPDLSDLSGCWIAKITQTLHGFWQPHRWHKKWQLSFSNWSNWSSKCLENTFQNVLRWASCQLTTSLVMWFPSFASHVFAWHHEESMCVCRHLAGLNQRDFFLEVTDLEEWCKFQAKFQIQ